MSGSWDYPGNLDEPGQSRRRCCPAGSPSALPADSPCMLRCPSFDSYWLDRLFGAGGMRARVPLTDVHMLYRWACRDLASLLPPLSAPGREAAERSLERLAQDIVVHARNPRAEPSEPGIGRWRTHAASGGSGAAIQEAVQQHLRKFGL